MDPWELGFIDTATAQTEEGQEWMKCTEPLLDGIVADYQSIDKTPDAPPSADDNTPPTTTAGS